MRFSPSASIYIFTNKDAYFLPSELKEVVRQGVQAVSPWLSTRSKATETYVMALDLNWRQESSSRYHSFAGHELILHIGQVRLGLGQLFAFQCYVESVVKAIAELQIRGIAAVSANVDFTVSVKANASTANARKVIAKGHL